VEVVAQAKATGIVLHSRKTLLGWPLPFLLLRCTSTAIYMYMLPP